MESKQKESSASQEATRRTMMMTTKGRRTSRPDVETLRTTEIRRQGADAISPFYLKEGNVGSCCCSRYRHQLIQPCFRIPLCQHTLPNHSTLDDQYPNDYQALVLPRCRIDDAVIVVSSVSLFGPDTRPSHPLNPFLLLSCPLLIV